MVNFRTVVFVFIKIYPPFILEKSEAVKPPQCKDLFFDIPAVCTTSRQQCRINWNDKRNTDRYLLALFLTQ